MRRRGATLRESAKAPGMPLPAQSVRCFFSSSPATCSTVSSLSHMRPKTAKNTTPRRGNLQARASRSSPSGLCTARRRRCRTCWDGHLHISLLWPFPDGAPCAYKPPPPVLTKPTSPWLCVAGPRSAAQGARRLLHAGQRDSVDDTDQPPSHHRHRYVQESHTEPLTLTLTLTPSP